MAFGRPKLTDKKDDAATGDTATSGEKGVANDPNIELNRLKALFSSTLTPDNMREIERVVGKLKSAMSTPEGRAALAQRDGEPDRSPTLVASAKAEPGVGSGSPELRDPSQPPQPARQTAQREAAPAGEMENPAEARKEATREIGEIVFDTVRRATGDFALAMQASSAAVNNLNRKSTKEVLAIAENDRENPVEASAIALAQTASSNRIIGGVHVGNDLGAQLEKQIIGGGKPGGVEAGLG